MTTVYRLESRALPPHGPFRPGHNSDLYDLNRDPSRHRSCQHIPLPHEDGFSMDIGYSEFIYGFRSLDDFLYYFSCPQGRAALSQFFVIRVYTPAKVIRGHNQVAFIPLSIVKEIELATVENDSGCVR